MKISIQYVIQALTVLLLLPLSAFARPYDCPAKDPTQASKTRKLYACEIVSKVHPDYAKEWSKIVQPLVPVVKQYDAKYLTCFEQVGKKSNQCVKKCEADCTTKQCVNSCAVRCAKKKEISEKKCNDSTFNTVIKASLRKPEKFAQKMENECNRSKGASACEQAEAAPYCDPLVKSIRNYRKVVRSKKNLNQKVDALVSVSLDIQRSLKTRAKDLGEELKAGNYKCDKTQAQAFFNIPNSTEELACIMPLEPDNQGFQTKALHHEEFDLSYLVETPGINSRYCWQEDTECDPSTSYPLDLGSDPEALEWSFTPQGISGSSLCTGFPSPVTLKLDQVFKPANLCPGYLYKAAYTDSKGGQYSFSLLVQDRRSSGPTYMAVHLKNISPDPSANYWIYGWQADNGKDWYKKINTPYFNQCNMNASSITPPVTKIELP